MYVSLIQIIYLGCNLGSRLCNNLLIPFLLFLKKKRGMKRSILKLTLFNSSTGNANKLDQ